MDELRAHWNVRTTATHFGVTPQTIRQWCRSGDLAHWVSPGGTWMITTDSIRALPHRVDQKEGPTDVE